MKSNYKKLGKYIQPVNLRNKDLRVDKLLGVSIKKVLMPSIANTIGTDMKTYKIIKRNQFAYGSVTSRNGEKISIALAEDYDEAIVSQAYTVFEVIDENELNPEYLMMWFRRPEFDRYARFMSHGSARETFDWDEMLETELPIPSLEKQREIVKEYNTVVNRIKLNEQLNKKLEETAQALYKQWFVDFEFPNEQGKPYKSSGGKMVFNDELEKEVPEGWGNEPVMGFGKVVTGKTPSSRNPEHFGEKIPFVTPTDFNKYEKYVIGAIRKLSDEGVKSLTNKVLPVNSLIVSCIGSDMGKVIVNSESCITNQQINSLVLSDAYMIDFLYNYFKDIYEHLRNIATGSSTMLMINKTEFELIQILSPSKKVCKNFNKVLLPINNKILQNGLESIALKEMKDLLLSKMTKVELEKITL